MPARRSRDAGGAEPAVRFAPDYGSPATSWASALFRACLLLSVAIFTNARLKFPFADYSIPDSVRIHNGGLRAGEFYLKNMSLGLNYHVNNGSCFHEGDSFSFRPNRLWHGGEYQVMLEFFVFYASGRMFGFAAKFADAMLRLAPWFHACPDPVIPVLVAVDTDLVDFFRRHELFNSSAALEFPGDESRYEIFLFGPLKIPIIYAFIRQNTKDVAWLNRVHRQADCNDFLMTFPGYYALTFALILVLPYRMRIFDFFDFFIRLDFDVYVPSCDGYGCLFATREMADRHFYASGCQVNYDHHCVAINVFKMTFAHLEKKRDQCQLPLRVPSLENGVLHSETLNFPGRFQQFWLGLYSSPEVGEFTWHYYNWERGWQYYRWGDQQYYFLVNALFSINANQTMRVHYDLVCRWGHKGMDSESQKNIRRAGRSLGIAGTLSLVGSKDTADPPRDRLRAGGRQNL